MTWNSSPGTWKAGAQTDEGDSLHARAATMEHRKQAGCEASPGPQAQDPCVRVHPGSSRHSCRSASHTRTAVRQQTDRCTTKAFNYINPGSVLAGRAREGCRERTGRWGVRRSLPEA